MGIRPLKEGSSLEARLSHLLYELCVDWGFCISPADVQRIASTKNRTADQFAYAVLTAEGFGAEQETRWFVKIRQRFVDRLAKNFEQRTKRSESPQSVIRVDLAPRQRFPVYPQTADIWTDVGSSR
jgi:hypothetical protein